MKDPSGTIDSVCCVRVPKQISASSTDRTLSAKPSPSALPPPPFLAKDPTFTSSSSAEYESCELRLIRKGMGGGCNSMIASDFERHELAIPNLQHMRLGSCSDWSFPAERWRYFHEQWPRLDSSWPIFENAAPSAY